MKKVDLRSDTITKPTGEMRKAMSNAQVGDDVFGEDPTVNKLEEMAAAITGKEDALFVCSGTMGNLVSELAHCGRGDEMILGDESHIFYYEQGGSAAIGGIHPRIVPNRPDGTMSIKDMESAIRADNIHFPRSKLIVLENTHNRCTGIPLSVEYMKKVRELANKYGLKIHVDGARIFNAAIALGVDVKDLADPADSITFCLSKGLCAPAGSLVCGTNKVISEARRARKILGGGMRQIGILAAAGIVALNSMIERLIEDHENAKMLAEGLSGIDGISIDTKMVKTNIVYFDIVKDNFIRDEILIRLARKGVKLLFLGPEKMRAVTHYHIKSDDIEYVIDVFKEIMS